MKEKNLKKQLKILLFTIFVLNGCARVEIKDDPWCADAGIYGAECVYAVSKRDFSLNQFQWNRLRLGQICSATENPGEGYKNIRRAIEQLCSDTDRCSFEQSEAKRSVLEALDALIGASNRALNLN